MFEEKGKRNGHATSNNVTGETLKVASFLRKDGAHC